MVQRLRNGTNRRALVAKLAKAVSLTTVDDITGSRASRKRARLPHCRSAKAVARAGPLHLQTVDGIAEGMAQTVADHFAAKE